MSLPRPPHRTAPRGAGALFLAPLLASLACGSGGATAPAGDAPASVSFDAADGPAPAGMPFPTGAAVVVRTAEGAPVMGAVVRFQVLAGGGWVSATADTTGSDGRARVHWYLGGSPGPNALRAAVAGLTDELHATGTPLTPGQSYFGRGGYIELIAGDLPLVVSAPHGGSLHPEEMPERTEGTLVRDTNTEELARQIAAAAQAELGGTPHVVISRVHRVHLDPNREIGEAAQGNPAAELAWQEFQSFIGNARARVTESHGHGFYIDLHGHGHDIQRLELGYLLSAAELGAPDATLNTRAGATSVREMVTRTGQPLTEVLKGPASLGALLATRGFPAVPSPADPSPGSDPYFSGGYNTERHGSRLGGTVSGVQIECNYEGVRNNLENREAFAAALVDALEGYFGTWFTAALAPAVAAGG